MTQTMCCCSSA
ncbi:hypothetical protein E2C01_098136 [Portunus trituberculatus]|uniref:Uncharacterized protein n=1 Tax=Portunus trituberculatus TaxID=210409 RepID=A0A5B7K7L1_PORTR|nr:hypothetical protein [Portunus trituberculatus]